MNTMQGLMVAAGVLLLGTAVLATGRLPPAEPSVCVTHEQVLLHLDRSRNGISLTCNEAVRARNEAARRASRSSGPESEVRRDQLARQP